MPTATHNCMTQFHADLSDAHPDEDHWISVAGERVPLLPHDGHTLRAAFAAAPHLNARNGAGLPTHYAVNPLPMAVDSPMRVHVRHSLKHSPNAVGRTGIGHVAMFIPPATDRLASLPSDHVEHAPTLNWTSTAKSFLLHHPDLLNKDAELVRLIYERYMEEDEIVAQEVNQLATFMRKMGLPTETSGWARLTPFQMPVEQEDGSDDGDDLARTLRGSGETYYNLIPTDDFLREAIKPLAPLIVAVKNADEFKDRKWSVQHGSSVEAAAEPMPPDIAAGEGASDPSWSDPTKTWRAAVANKDFVSGFKVALDAPKPGDAEKRLLRLKLENKYIRYLGAYIRFYDIDDKPISVPDWKPENGGATHALITDLLDLQYPDVRYLGYLDPVNNTYAFPIGPNGELAIDVVFPANAVRANVYGSGLGHGDNRWPKTPVVGGLQTVFWNFGAPSVALGFGAAIQSWKTLYDIIQNLMKNEAAIKIIGSAAVLFLSVSAKQAIKNQKIDYSRLTTILSFIFSKAYARAVAWVGAQCTAQAAADQIPFAGWVMVAINVTAGVAQMAQTIVEVATSDWNIEHAIATAVTTSVKVRPDPRAKAFPSGGASAQRRLVVTMTYRDQRRGAVSRTIPVPAGSTAEVLTAVFPDNALGGYAKFEADFYVGDWLAGKATTGYVANDAQHAESVALLLVQFPAPLTERSVYAHSRILSYQGNAFTWKESKVAPTATITSRDASPAGNAFGDWTSIALSQRAGMVGFAWQAAGMGIADCESGASGQLFAFQNLAIPGLPMAAVKFPACGFSGPARLIYDPFPPKFQMKDGSWLVDKDGRPLPDRQDDALGDYYVDPRSGAVALDEGGGYHLRRVTLDASTPFDLKKGQKSYGRFTYFPDSVALHPSGLLIGISSKYKKLQTVRLVREGAADNDVPIAQVGSGPALDPKREGLMFHPVAVACAYDGTIIVLEDTKSSDGTSKTMVSRLSAYNLDMNPERRFFDEDGRPSQWLPLGDSAAHHYLDLAVVGSQDKTYIYVLYHRGRGADPSDYRMSIYTVGKTKSERNPLVTTEAFVAAKLTVDMWHSAYALNFAMVADEAGKPAGPASPGTGPAGRTMPSVSVWTPAKG